MKLIISEPRYLRNRETENPDTGYSGSNRKKECFLLTATPINNRLSDFRHLIELLPEDRVIISQAGSESIPVKLFYPARAGMPSSQRK